MEGNRDEAEKCIGIAREALEAGDRDRALRFLGKAQKLYPTDAARGERAAGPAPARGASRWASARPGLPWAPRKGTEPFGVCVGREG